MADLPAFGSAPIRCSRARCKWRGFETDLKKVPGRIGRVACTNNVCPVCGNDSYMHMTPGEIAAWERAKAAAEINRFSDGMLSK